MSYNLKYQRGLITDPLSLRDATGLNVENIASLMRDKLQEMGIPANISTDTVKEGGLFGKTYPCVVIKHPNPPQQYFDDVYIVNGNTVNFMFFGNSAANYQTNKANARANTIMGSIMNAVSGSSEMAYQQEMFWHKQVLEAFESFVN